MMDNARRFWSWSMRSRRRAVVVLGSLAFACICSCGALFSLVPNEETAAPTEQVSPNRAIVPTSTAARAQSIQIFTDTPLAEPTATPASLTTATPIPAFTATIAPSATPVPAWAGTATINAEVVNLRAGPSTDHDIVRQATQGETLQVYGRTDDSAWLQLDDAGTMWVFAELATVDVELGVIPVTAAAAQPVDVRPTAPVVVCDCSGDIYNCDRDFNTRNQAQACFDYCWSQVGRDVHGLDTDDDREACESLP